MKTLLKISLQDLCRIKEPARVKQGQRTRSLWTTLAYSFLEWAGRCAGTPRYTPF